jgi:hypothetical protein
LLSDEVVCDIIDRWPAEVLPLTWTLGEPILMRHVHEGQQVVRATPVRVISDDDAYLVTWVAPGTEQLYPFGRAEGGGLLSLAEWGLEKCRWWGWGMLELTPPGRRHAIRLFWDENGVFEGWYVNLQEPAGRYAGGYDTMDWQLDIWVTSDRVPSWKDEDDVRVALATGLLTGAQAREAREERLRVIAERPWPTGWEDWTPPTEWTPLLLPEDWAQPAR